MRTTISIPDEELKREKLARAMDEGYGIEARSPSLDGDWSVIEAEGLESLDGIREALERHLWF